MIECFLIWIQQFHGIVELNYRDLTLVVSEIKKKASTDRCL